MEQKGQKGKKIVTQGKCLCDGERRGIRQPQEKAKKEYISKGRRTREKRKMKF